MLFNRGAGAATILLLSGMAPGHAADTMPYFASIKSDKIYMRVGPGEDYAIKWVYHRKGLPVEVLGSYDAWRRVKDMDGETGWIHTALLSRERTAVVIGDGLTTVTRSDEAGSNVVAKAKPGTVGTLRHCQAQSCEVKFDGVEGWVPRARLWGVSNDDKF
ncbi:MAG TPA: SH3 domain-containing protein [Micropepsaceae bacterium]|nr:SH3 domain-containing protein [Micropepsaceae bacterium]